MEFITHPAVTRIFAKEIEQYGIKSLIISDTDRCQIKQHDGYPYIHSELFLDIRHAAITAKHEDEAAIDPHEDSDTIKAAIINRQK